MAYAPVPTVSVGQLWTAANHNAYIRDNFAAGIPDIFTTKGDLAVGSAAQAAGRLGVGGNYSVLIALQAASAGLSWQSSAPGAQASYSGTQSVPNDVDTTVITLDTEVFDTPNPPMGFYPGSGNILTVPGGLGGVYEVSVSGIYAAHATPGKHREVGIKWTQVATGVITNYFGSSNSDANSSPCHCQMRRILALAAGDTIQGLCHQISAAALNMTGGQVTLVRLQ